MLRPAGLRVGPKEPGYLVDPPVSSVDAPGEGEDYV